MTDTRTHLYIFGYENFDGDITLGDKLHKCSWSEAHNEAAREISNALQFQKEHPSFIVVLKEIHVIELMSASVIVNPNPKEEGNVELNVS